jgi:hypothetical protein
VENMKGNLYGSAGNAFLNPKTFMVQALKKIILNNGLILKFGNEKIGDNEKIIKIRMRIMNSVALLTEMKLHLNIKDGNPAVESVMISFDWLLREMDEIETIALEEKETLIKKINDINYILKNILEGFETIE